MQQKKQAAGTSLNRNKVNSGKYQELQKIQAAGTSLNGNKVNSGKYQELQKIQKTSLTVHELQALA